MVKVTVVAKANPPPIPNVRAVGVFFPVPLERNALYGMNAGRIREGRQNEESGWVKRKENELYGVDWI